MFDHLSEQDFDRARRRAFWRQVFARLTGKDNQLLPYDDVRRQLPLQGQHDLGLRQVPISLIVGSSGRYRDFDRAFLPLQTRTRERWINIDRAHYEDMPLPPVDLYKLGEVYFVKDGNHRVSVARQRGQEFIDAYITEVEVPVKLTTEIRMDELALKSEQAEFLLQTGLNETRLQAQVETSSTDAYCRLMEHIAVHRWYLGEQRKAEVPYREAAASWYDQIYSRVINLVQEQGILAEFPGYREADLYLWIMEYEALVRRAYQQDYGVEDAARVEAARRFAEAHTEPVIRKLVTVLDRTDWMDDLILGQERAAFLEQTRLVELRLQADVHITLPGQYDKLRQHIAAHRWFLGEQCRSEVPYFDAVASWYDHVYSPLVEIIRQQELLKEFPGRTETDLYLWIIERQWYLREYLAEEVTMEQAAEQFAEDYSQRPLKKLVNAIKRLWD